MSERNPLRLVTKAGQGIEMYLPVCGVPVDAMEKLLQGIQLWLADEPQIAGVVVRLDVEGAEDRRHAVTSLTQDKRR